MAAKASASGSVLKSRKVQLMPGGTVEYPDLWLKVYVEGPEHETRPFAEMFVRSWCSKADTPDQADLVVFAGGEDVNPIFYDEEAHPQTSFNTKRDERDMILYADCLDKGIPMLGICRGAQFLHVMNGGKLYQHVDKHVGEHPMWDVRNKMIIEKVSSVHHQMCMRNVANGMQVLGESSVATERWKNKTDKVRGSMADVEAFFYRDTCCLGIQGHPEYRGYDQFLRWTFQQINDLIVCNPDIVLEEIPDLGRMYRMKKDLIEQRAQKWAEKAKELN
jgi:gamma-glutamyl-gamma-aminobutyrate hydrolase PuuD